MAVDKPIWNYVLPLIALFVLAIMWFWNDGSLFQQAKDAVTYTYDHFVPDINIGERSLKAGKTTLEGSTLESAESLKATLTSLSNESTGKNCFARYAPLTADMGDNAGTAMFLFNYDQTHNSTHVVIYKRKDVVASEFDVPNMKPCVIAGYEKNVEIALNFRNAQERGDFSQATIPYIYPVDTLHIQYSQSYWNGNIIRIDQLLDGTAPDKEVVNDESKNFEDGGLIFKGPDNEVCFFPTNFIQDASEDGLDNNYVQELGTKFDSGDSSVRQCHLEKGFDAITLTSNMDASSSDSSAPLDCTNLVNNQPIDKKSQRIHVTAKHQNINGISSPCSSYLLPQKPSRGCVAITQTTTNPSMWSCANMVVREGEVIPSTLAEFGLKPYIDTPQFASTAAYCSISQGEWFTNDENALLCQASSWQECTKDTVNKEVTIAYNPQPITYKCTSNDQYYLWVKEKGNLDFTQYRGIEIAGSPQGAYPLGCDSQFDIVASKCDYSGKMGVSLPRSKVGQFICPSQNSDCADTENGFPSLDILSPKGCQVFMSDESSSDSPSCGRALVPFGTLLSESKDSSLYGCVDQSNCDLGPLEIVPSPLQDNNLPLSCLLKHQWSLPETEQGDLLCSKAFNDQDGVWNECNQRVAGRCLNAETPTGTKQFCCNLNKGENTFRFIETPITSSN